MLICGPDCIRYINLDIFFFTFLVYVSNHIVHSLSFNQSGKQQQKKKLGALLHSLARNVTVRNL